MHDVLININNHASTVIAGLDNHKGMRGTKKRVRNTENMVGLSIHDNILSKYSFASGFLKAKTYNSWV